MNDLVYSEYYNEYIPLKEAILTDLDIWIYMDEAIEWCGMVIHPDWISEIHPWG